MLFFIFLEHIYSKNLLPLPAAPRACPPEGLPQNPGSRWSHQCLRVRNAHSQSSRELSTGELLLIHIQVLALQEPRSLLTKAALLSPGYKWSSVKDFIPSQGQHVAPNPGLTLEKSVATPECQVDPEPLPLSPAAQAVLHTREQSHPKSPVCPKSRPEDSSEIRNFQDLHVLLPL